MIPLLNCLHSFTTMKKQERLEKKKRKIVALANIMEINENDKKSKSKSASESDNASEDKVVTASETVRSLDLIENLSRL